MPLPSLVYCRTVYSADRPTHCKSEHTFWTVQWNLSIKEKMTAMSVPVSVQSTLSQK